MTKDLFWDRATQYAGAQLDLASCDVNPLVQFRAWFQAAEATAVPDANAFMLATVGEAGYPEARVLLLKELDATGFVFFTNYASRKGRELSGSAKAAMTFFWQPLHRQVRIVGDVTRISEAESDAYFASRPRDSQLGAHASPQSEEIAGRETIMRNVIEAVGRFGAGEVPRPAHWGGYRLVPRRIEFWQGQASRLHDRVEYLREGQAWRRRMLAP